MNDFFDQSYIPQYFAVKIYVKPYLKKQRSFNRSTSITSANSSKSSGNSKRRFASFITALDEVYQEIEIMKRIEHPNVIRLFEIIDDPSSDKLYLIMPVADYGECIEWDAKTQMFHPNHRLQAKNINKLHKTKREAALFYDEDQIRKMARALISALDYLHNQVNIVHRDIKPQNIMIDEAGNPLLVDFGKAKLLQTEDEDLTTSMEGSYTFLAPECCSFETSTYSMKKADIWALGITLYILTFNRFPFNVGQTEIDLMENICSFKLSFEGREISNELQEMLTIILEKDPNKRASLQDLMKCRFINHQNQDDVLKFPEEDVIMKDEQNFKHSDSFNIQMMMKPSFQIQECEKGDSPRIITHQIEQ